VSAKRVTVVTSGHPSTCPRMVKAADAAVEAGYDVRFVSVDYIGWAPPLDTDLVSRRQWRWTPIALQRTDHPLTSRWISARHGLAAAAAARIDPARAPIATVVRAYGRTHPELVEAILAEPFDLVYGGTVGALAAIAESGRRARKPFALDFEDFHPAESEEEDADTTHALAARVVGDAIQGSSFTTAASAPIARAYSEQFSTSPLVVHNVVARPHRMPPTHTDVGSALKLYWFSQVIGPKRGLEDVVRAVAHAQVPAELHLRGAAREEYLAALRSLARDEHAQLDIVVHGLAAPDAMVDVCEPFDVGLSLEQEGVLNRALCLPNKPLTYFAAGLAVIATDTPGQLVLRDAAASGIWWYRPGDIPRLAEGLRRWHCDRSALQHARECSYHAALTRFHWEHPLERGVLVEAMAGALS
jgi:glycosyltransferase involved in cell wall biosynthesis